MNDETPRGAAPARPDGPPAGPPRRGPGPARVVLALLVALVLGAAAWVGWQLMPPDPGATAPVVFDLEPGWGAARAARELEEEGLVRDAEIFALYLRFAGLDRAVGEGLYDLTPGLSAPEVARRLAEGGRPRIALVAIPEGFRARDVARRAAQRGVADEEEALALAADPGELGPAWLPDGAGLEGYLFPDSYQLRLDAGAEEALRVMVEQFEERVDDELRARVAEAGLDLHDWTILASMVQAEAAGADEMPIVAGVFLNRLDRDMLLQSDPTVAYGLGKDLPDLSAVDGDIRSDHAWNTYTRPGLPAGPIGNPGTDALEAVLAPERTTEDGEPWLYFLHGTDDGEPVFRPNVSLADHERDIDRFLR